MLFLIKRNQKLENENQFPILMKMVRSKTNELIAPFKTEELLNFQFKNPR